MNTPIYFNYQFQFVGIKISNDIVKQDAVF